jgi:hypothetical protein
MSSHNGDKARANKKDKRRRVRRAQFALLNKRAARSRRAVSTGSSGDRTTASPMNPAE